MPAESSRAAPEQATGTILIVEDEEPIRRLMARMLQMNGYQTLAAANGVEALELCQKHAGRIDLVITDLVLPKLDGRQLVNEVKKDRKDFKVLFMSGYSDGDDLEDEVRDLEVAFISKPFNLDALLEKVRQLLKA